MLVLKVSYALGRRGEGGGNNSYYVWNISLQKDGCYIAWQHLIDLYERDKGKATGLAMATKLKFEHIHLTSFAKMRVDLAAQVMYITLDVVIVFIVVIMNRYLAKLSVMLWPKLGGVKLQKQLDLWSYSTSSLICSTLAILPMALEKEKISSIHTDILMIFVWGYSYAYIFSY